MRDALSKLDQVIAFCGDDVAEADVQGLLGMVDRRLLLETAEGVLGRDSRRVLEAVRRADDLGHSFRSFAQEMVEIFRALVLIKVLDDPGDLLDAAVEEIQALRRLAEAPALEDLQRIQTVLMRTEADLANSPNPRLTLEMGLVRVANLPPARELSALVRKIESLEARLAEAPLHRAAPPPPPAAPRQEPRQEVSSKKAEAPASPGEGGWQGLVDHVRGNRPLIASLLERGSLLTLDPPKLEIGFPSGSFHLEQIRDAETLQTLSALAEAYFGAPVEIRVTPVDGKSEDRPLSLLEERQVQESDRKRRLREDALAHPMVRSVLEIFGGNVKEVRPIDKGYV
jgi:DNA polymerase III subunit gamma/tau